MVNAESGRRAAEIVRESTETRITVKVDLDGNGPTEISTGIGFFDHMLQLMAFHGRLGLTLQANGDLEVDDHHTVEDIGIVLGRAIAHAREGSAIERYADLHMVMDEALVLVALDISGRGMLTYDVEFKREQIGELATENIREFFRALSVYAGITLHIRKVTGLNDHHVAEAIFKGFGRALYTATRLSSRGTVASTKGMLD